MSSHRRLAQWSAWAWLLVTSGCAKCNASTPVDAEHAAPDAASSHVESPLGTPAAVVVTNVAPSQLLSPSPPGVRPRLILTPKYLEELAKRAKQQSSEWTRLQSYCDKYLSGHVEWPDGNSYADAPHIGHGYQGSGYLDAIVNLGVCYQVQKTLDPSRADPYGKKVVDILTKMSESTGPHSVSPLRDHGYGIRNFGIGMALGYDWAYPLLSAAEKKRVYLELNRWIDAFDKEGFGREHAQGNYFAGYYAAKGLAALATDGDNPSADLQWKDWLSRLHGKMVQPFYAQYMAGGGWPEGWNYGPLASINMVLPVLGAHTAKGLDLVSDAKAPFRFPVEQAANLLHYSWPNRATLDDRGALYGNANPSRTQPSVFTFFAGALELLNDPLAPSFHRFTQEVIDLHKLEDVPPWQLFVFWNPKAPEADYRSQPLSFYARGMQTVEARSSWDRDAVWATFTSGTHVNYPGSGEMSFDQGSLAIVRGGRPLLCNTGGAMNRHSPGTTDGESANEPLYNDLFGNNDADRELGNRTIYNIFYAKTAHYGQISAEAPEVHTHVGLFEDGGAYVAMRGDKLEEMYRAIDGDKRPVKSWSRQIVYLRPELFVVDDRTETNPSATDQWQAFHFAGALKEVPQEAGKRYEVGDGRTYAGSVISLLPNHASASIVNVFKKNKVFRLEMRPSDKSAEQRWITLFDVANDATLAGKATLFSASDKAAPDRKTSGVLLQKKTQNYAVLSNAGKLTDAFSDVSYSLPVGKTLHVITSVKPNAEYAITVTPSGGAQGFRVVDGKGIKASDKGILSFESEASGSIHPASSSVTKTR